MLIATLKINKEKYFIYLNTNGKLSYSAVLANKDGARPVEENEIVDLLHDIFNSDNLNYINTYKEYKIYLDEAGNKRFFKNNKEDFNMFFQFNGVDATLYNEEENIDENNDNSLKTKMFTFISDIKKDNMKKAIVVMTAVFLGVNTVFLSLLNHTSPVYKIKQVISPKSMDATTAVNMINESKRLTLDEKELLSQYNVLDDLISFASDDRYYELYSRLNNIGVEEFGKLDPNYNTCVGYYSPIFENNLFIKNTINNKNEIEEVVPHEFIHLMQNSDCNYKYIHEACAEIFSYEYFNSGMNAYTDAVKRTRVLMEIIGPKSIIDCNFNSDYSSFEDEIKKYLDKDDAKKLLGLFKTTSNKLITMSDEDTKKLNSEIDELLSKMYYNKTGCKIEDNKMIKEIYDNKAPNRIYFNKKHPKFNTAYYFGNEHYNTESSVEVDNDYLNYISNNSNILKIIYNKNTTYSEEDYIKYRELLEINSPSIFIPKNGAKEEKVITTNIAHNGEQYNIVNDYINCNGEIVRGDIAYNKGYAKFNYVHTDSIEVFDYNNIVSPGKYDTVDIYGKDGSICKMVLENGVWVPHSKTIPLYGIEPSIYETFKEQFTGNDLDSMFDYEFVISENQEIYKSI